ncbi:MAG: hypothetical protein EBS90_10475, partial [Betaproteobacteria bacterium]|nr:hypothetical protein [Betaproteobacteria bacterium]
MSATSQDRWNRFKAREAYAAHNVIYATQFLVHPLGSYPPYNIQDIQPIWARWAEEYEIFWRMTESGPFVPPVFPKMPAIDAPYCCYRMWGLLIQAQVQGTKDNTEHLRETVVKIVGEEVCKKHPEICPCHVPDHPWTSPEQMEALAPINPKHRIDCNCGGDKLCKAKARSDAPHRAFPTEFCSCDAHGDCSCGRPKKKNVEIAMRLDASGNLAPEMGEALCGKGWAKVVVPSPYDYKHKVETCACGICYKARVDSGQAGAEESLRRIYVAPLKAPDGCQQDWAALQSRAAELVRLCGMAESVEENRDLLRELSGIADQ